MNLAQALKKIPWKHRGKMMQVLDIAINRVTEELLEKLTPEQSEKLKEIKYSDRPALINFVMDNFPDVEKLIWNRLVVFTEESSGVKE